MLFLEALRPYTAEPGIHCQAAVRWGWCLSLNQAEISGGGWGRSHLALPQVGVCLMQALIILERQS